MGEWKTGSGNTDFSVLYGIGILPLPEGKPRRANPGSGIIGTALAGGKRGEGRIVTCLPWSSPAASDELEGWAKTPSVVVRHAVVVVRGWRVTLIVLA